ncbi:hypothetical protein EV131_12361 [Rhizobium laguerreae]|uniref:Uncharacterized protein n=1 Tax=Rhizobium laguerreae TaxID=1076926 RepID=A0AAX2QCD8_9HYPH|nr:hypothetical protein EV131_12361 [Rhizobium laguerreae]
MNQVADPLLTPVPVRPLMPYELYLEPFRKPRYVYPCDLSQAIPHQTARHQCDKVAAADNARNHKERGGRRDSDAGVTECLQGDVHRRGKYSARRRDDHLFKPGEPGCSRPFRDPWVPGTADQNIAFLKQVPCTQVSLPGIRCGDGQIDIAISQLLR